MNRRNMDRGNGTKVEYPIKYLATEGSRLKDADARILGPVFESLMETGPIRPQDIVDAARPKHSLIHNYFTWDNAVAAEHWRCEEARYYLRHIEVIRAEAKEPIRLFHRVGLDTKEGGYVTLQNILERPGYLAQVREQCQRELIGIQRRYRQYKELIPSIEALQPIIDGLSLAKAKDQK